MWNAPRFAISKYAWLGGLLLGCIGAHGQSAMEIVRGQFIRTADSLEQVLDRHSDIRSTLEANLDAQAPHCEGPRRKAAQAMGPYRELVLHLDSLQRVIGGRDALQRNDYARDTLLAVGRERTYTLLTHFFDAQLMVTSDSASAVLINGKREAMIRGEDPVSWSMKTFYFTPYMGLYAVLTKFKEQAEATATITLGSLLRECGP